MGSCIICGVDVDGGGRICDPHQEDVVFDFHGNAPDQLVPDWFYRGVVDGYAEFGVFIDLAPGVTGLLHRSELDRRLDSLDWEPGDEVFVQVKGVRDNGNIDLAWSIRQADREFRGVLVQDGDTEHLPEEDDEDDAADEDEAAETEPAEPDAPDEDDGSSGTDETVDDDESADDDEAVEDDAATAADGPADEGVSTRSAEDDVSDAAADEAPTDAESETEGDESQTDDSEDLDDDRERVEIGALAELVGDEVQIDGEVVGVRQTGGPTIFEVRDESGVVDVAAFVEPGARAYPSVEVGDVVRIDGEVESHRGDVQVESAALVLLEDDEADAVRRRLAEALTDEARPDGLQPLAGDETVAQLADGLLDAAEAIRRAVLESRPIVVRHTATADGYVAGAAVERAVLPLIRDEHAKSDAEYHYFTRRPLDDPVYGMDAATNDATRMLQDRDRHDEKLPLFLLVGTGSTVESADGIDLLSVYGVDAVVVDAEVADPETREAVDTLVSPEIESVEGDLST